MQRPSRQRAQSGMFLIEVLVSMLIFLLGILALMGVSTVAVSAQSDAQYRTDAATLANEISQSIWVGVDRSSADALRDSLQDYEHQTSGDAASCAYSGGTSSKDAVTNWVDKVTNTAKATHLPGSTAAMQQITVNTTTNEVTINVCWKAPKDIAPRRYVLTTVVN